MSARVKHVDIAKGISIILVAMFHSGLKLFFPYVIYPMGLFRMPLFFFLSGVFFSYTVSPKTFLTKKTEALLKPYFFVLFVVLILEFFLFEGKTLLQTKGILYGNGDTIKSPKWLQLWFLTHLFAVYCFNYILFRFTIFKDLAQNKKWLFLLFSLFLGASNIDIFWHKEITFFNETILLPGLPFSLDIILVTSAYFLAGHLLKKQVINFSPNTFYFILSIAVFLGLNFFSQTSTDLNARIYSSPLLGTIGAISGIYMILFISSIINRYKLLQKTFLAFGSASLYILLFHAWISGTIYQYAIKNISNNDMLLLISIVAFLLSISIPLVIKSIVLRNDFLSLFFLPFKTNTLLQKVLYRHKSH